MCPRNVFPKTRANSNRATRHARRIIPTMLRRRAQRRRMDTRALPGRTRALSCNLQDLPQVHSLDRANETFSPPVCMSGLHRPHTPSILPDRYQKQHNAIQWSCPRDEGSWGNILPVQGCRKVTGRSPFSGVFSWPICCAWLVGPPPVLPLSRARLSTKGTPGLPNHA